jgi:hypothetical protein
MANSDLDAMVTGFRPDIIESETNQRAKKAQKDERDLLTPFAQVIITHLEHERAQVSDISSFMLDKVDSPSALLDEFRARKLYIKKLEELESWIKIRLSKIN